MRTTVKITAALAVAGLGLTACGTASDPSAATGAEKEDAPLVVAASPTPHADILTWVDDNLAAKAGLDLKVKEFTDYVLPNKATENGEVDANFFQHQPYLTDFNKQEGTHLASVAKVHLEPLGLYAKSLKSAEDLKAGDTVAVPNDTTNEGRALQLLDARGVIDLKPGAGADAGLSDVADDHGLTLKELEAASLPRSLDDVDAAVINGNYALDAGLTPAKDALFSEKTAGNPYANVLVVKKGQEDDPRVRKLVKLLHSDALKKHLEDTYQGAATPAF